MRGLFLTFSTLSHDLAAHPDRTPASHRLPRRTPFFISGDTRRSFSSRRTNGLDSLELKLDSGHCHYNVHGGFYTQGRAGHAPTSQPTSSTRPARSARAPSDMHAHVWARRARDGPAQRAHPRSPTATLHHGPAAPDTPGARPYTRLTHLTRAPRLCAMRLNRCRAEPPRRASRIVVVVEAATTQVLRGLLTVPPQPPRPPRRAAHLHRPTHGPEHRAAARRTPPPPACLRQGE